MFVLCVFAPVLARDAFCPFERTCIARIGELPTPARPTRPRSCLLPPGIHVKRQLCVIRTVCVSMASSNYSTQQGTQNDAHRRNGRVTHILPPMFSTPRSTPVVVV